MQAFLPTCAAVIGDLCKLCSERLSTLMAVQVHSWRSNPVVQVRCTCIERTLKNLKHRPSLNTSGCCRQCFISTVVNQTVGPISENVTVSHSLLGQLDGPDPSGSWPKCVLLSQLPSGRILRDAWPCHTLLNTGLFFSWHDVTGPTV